jgi:phenylalanyl-tRNA synthetase beta subunit
MNACIDSLFHSIRSHRPHILEKFELIDLYQREGSPHKNATFRFTYRDPIKTISAEEVEQEHANLIAHIAPHSFL